MDAKKLLDSYDLNNLAIANLAGHSGLETSLGAKRQGFKSIVIVRPDRKKTYGTYLRTHPSPEATEGTAGCVDEVIEVEQFSDILKPEVQEELRKRNAILAYSRYYWVYFDDFTKIEKELNVPIFGSREMLRLEERDQSPNQYDLLQDAGIRIPTIFKSPNDIDRLTLTKVNNAQRLYERENFFASTTDEWQKTADEKIASGAVKKEDMDKCVIEEFILGAQVNFNFFYSPLSGRLELMGTDTRRQTSLDGWLRLPAKEQLKLEGLNPLHIETGHIAVTVKESLLEKAYEAGERFVETCKKYHPKGIIGPFGLQGAIVTDGTKEEFVVFDVSFRIPGSPGIMATPYSSYLFGRPVGMGERIAMELRSAVTSGRLEDVLT
jgi:5-formaminoimidazole-4-carboxamide-1-(beta)-D-ribofuranosyl 5'-monophosphate synthetase